MDIKINKDRLKIYLNKRKNYIEFNKYAGLAEIISGLSMLLAMLTTNIDSGIFKYPIIHFIGIFISVIILLYGLILFAISLKRHFTVDLCYKEICNLDDSNRRIQNVIIIKDNDQNGRFLLVYNSAWKCYLFPSFNSDILNLHDGDEQHILQNIVKECFDVRNQSIELQHIGDTESYKENIAEKCSMNYKFRFFIVKNIDLPKTKKVFKRNGHKFTWMSMDKMYANRNITKKNLDVIDYVNNRTNISKI